MSPIPRLHKETSLFNRTKTLSASFKVLADSITSLVEGKETYTDPEGNVVTNTFGTIIKQTANNVLIKATESSKTAAEGGAALITSLINVATEGVQIAASKVNIEGAAIFTGSGRLSQQTLNNTYDAKGTANTATKRSQRIYYRSSVSSAPNVMPTAWVTATGNKYNSTQSSASGWTTKVPPIASDTGENVSKYPYLWTCEQREQLNGELAYTNVLLDESSTVIDGGRLITGSVTANSLNARNINSSGILTVGSFTNEASESILNSNVESAASARSQTIYKSAAKGTTTMAANTTWVTVSGDTQNVWTTTRPTYSQDYPVLFVATQSQTVAQKSTTTCSCTTPVIDKTTTVIDGGNIITNSITADQIDANDLNLSGRLTIGALTPSTKSDVLNDNAISSIKDSMSGFTILWNYSEYSSPNAGEAYICAYDPLTNATSNENGWVTFNGVKRTITKQMANPNNILPYNVPIYIVCRLSSASATSGTNYMVWYDSGWKYAAMPTPSAIGGSWTWNNATDIILGKFVEPSNEGQLTECFVFNPPLTSKHVSTDTTTAASANSAASAAQSTANSANTNAATAQSSADAAQSTANSAIKSSVQLWFTKDNSTAPSAPTAHVTTNDASTANKWNIAVPTYNATYPHYFYCYEYLKGNNTYSWSPVVYDRATTESQSTARATSSSLANYIQSNNTVLSSLQSQVDGSVDIWYGSSDPTSSTAPWPSDDSKDIHVGDMYVNTATGKSFRYTKSGSTYAWTEIPDEAARAALSAAGSAKETADKKRRVFTVTPTVPYDVGDLWVSGTTIQYAKTARTSGSYNSSDWALTATDDTVASAAKSAAESAASAASSAQSTADNANNKLVSFRGICTTAAGTAAKTVACAGFALTQGYSITVYNTTAQTVGGAITLNVNSLGAKAVWVANAATSDTNRLYWSAGSTVTFVYDGTNFRVADNPGSYLGSTCSVAENNGTKVTSVGDCVIFKGTAVSVPMTYANTATSPTLNVSSTSARNIYYGTSTTVPTKENGFSWLPDTNVIFVFDGKFWKTGNQTFTDGKNLIIGSVSADKLNANDINAKNLLTIGALSTSTQNSILNSNVQVGSRNLLLGTKTAHSRTLPAVSAGNFTTGDPYAMVKSYSNLALTTSDYLTISFDWTVTNAPANATVRIGTNATPWEYFGTVITFAAGSSSGHVSKSYQVTSALASSAGTYLRYRIDAVGSAIPDTMVFTMSNVKLEKGNKATDWTPAPEDVSADSIKRTQRIYYRSNVNTKPTAMPTAWVTETGNKYNTNATTVGGWSTKVTPVSSSVDSSTKYIYLWTCEQREMADGTIAYTNVLLDDSMTVIDGGNIATGTITANKLNVNDINTKNSLTIGALSGETRDSILNSNITIGGRNVLLNSDTPSKFLKNTPNEYEVARLQIASGQGFVTDQWYTLQIWGYNYNRKSINAYVGGGNYNVASWMEMSSSGDLYVAFTFKATASMASATQDIRIYASNNIGTQGSTTISGSFTVTKAELERGNKPTDWTSAPEDVDGDIDAAAKTATNYIIYENATDGIKVTYNGTNAATQITSSGVDIINSSNVSVAKFGENVRIGKANWSRLEMDYHSMQLVDYAGNTYFHVSDLRDESGFATITETFKGDGSTNLFYVMYSAQYTVSVTDSSHSNVTYTYQDLASGDRYLLSETPSSGATVTIVYKTSATTTKALTFGSRSGTVGPGSVALGFYVEASGSYSTAVGSHTRAEGNYSYAEGDRCRATGETTHSEGRLTRAEGDYSHAEGINTIARGRYSHAEGAGTWAYGDSQHTCGKYNVTDTTSLLIVGKGKDSSRSNAMKLGSDGALWIAGSLTQNSDRRLKTHHAYLGKEACTFMRKLRPALFTKDGERHLGFYAQDVRDAEPENWDTVTVRPDHTDESLDFDPLTLDYTALIAPLTAYAQQLERRIEYLESTVDSLVEANDELREMVDNLIGERL